MPGGQGVAQRLALDPVGHGYAVAIHVGHCCAGGEEHPDDLELEVACSGGSARAGRCDRQVQRGRACLAGRGVRVGAGGQQGGNGGRASGAYRAVEGRYPAAVRLVNRCSGGDQQLDDAPLGARIPRRRQRPGVAGVMQRRRAAAVDRVDGGAGGEQGTGGVVPEPGRSQMQGRVAPVERVVQLRDEEVLFHALCGRGRRDPGRVVRQDRLEDGLHASSMHEGPDNLT